MKWHFHWQTESTNRLRGKPTERQLDFIAKIEEYVGDTFDGDTRQEASEWIDEHLDEYNQMQRFMKEESNNEIQ